MKKVNKYIAILFVAFMCTMQNAAAYPLPTFGPSMIAEALSQVRSEVESLKSEIFSTQNLTKQISNIGVVGHLKTFATNLSNKVKGKAESEYNKYKDVRKAKQLAKQKAFEAASKRAKEKLEAQQEGDAAAVAAVDQNRETAARNKESQFKKAYNWAKNKNNSARGWMNTQSSKAGDWLDAQGNKIIDSVSGSRKKD